LRRGGDSVLRYHFNWVTFHPVPTSLASDARELKIYGTDGNLIMGGGHFASVISAHREMLPEVDGTGWYHMADPYGARPSGGLPKPQGSTTTRNPRPI
jgi:hypothetical protein